MVHESVIRYLVSTYDLPPKLEDKITRIAIRRVAELGFNGLDTVYGYIDCLVEKFQRSYQRQLTNSIVI